MPAEEDFNHQNRIFVDFEGIIVEYTPENFSVLTHAYCVSIHKSQGSEYPIVIMPILNEHHIMLQRRLIYTGVTRAKKVWFCWVNGRLLKKRSFSRKEKSEIRLWN